MRNSSLEKCRILLFLMVVTIHVSSPFFNTNHIVGTFNWQISNLLDGCSRIAVNCFILISGYFMIEQKSGLPHIKKLLLPLFLLLIPYYGMYVISHGFLKSIVILFRDLLRADGYLYHLWFFQVIIVLYILSSYINIILNSLNKTEYKKFLSILLLLYSVFPTIGFLLECEFFKTSLFVSRLSLFILLYSIGGYLKKYPVHLPLKKLIPLFLGLELSVVGLTAFYNSPYSPLLFLHQLRGITPQYPFLGFAGTMYDYNNLFIIAASTCFFLIFAQKNYVSALTNQISKHIFNAYIIHVFWITVISKSIKLSPFIRFESDRYPLYLIGTILIVFILSLLSSVLLNMFLLFIRKHPSTS